MAEKVQVLGVWASSFSRRVELALKLKGIQYEYIEEDLSNKSPLLLNYNPVHKKIPVLVHNGNPIAESLVILEYIDETWKHNPILPQDPYGRAIARFWAKFVDEKILPAVWKAYRSGEEEREEAIEDARQQLKILEDELKGKNFFGGDAIGYVDIVAAVVAFWFGVLEEVVGIELTNEERFPLLFKWIGKLRDIDVVMECVPPREKHVAFCRAHDPASTASK